ncbi:uncharacterized protein LOC128918550 isoform X2 [Rissa tridactyla]|uniref:uncharacterized protein LOC128918550 isoform X2 n=1 Tax=Rissa tridactyla TaxID=75485 RepID=UPI0023BAC3AA|nr:uncharacterized protein LOC128918550 isoform X2 [Rissa tridactyla]
MQDGPLDLLSSLCQVKCLLELFEEVSGAILPGDPASAQSLASIGREKTSSITTQMPVLVFLTPAITPLLPVLKPSFFCGFLHLIAAGLSTPHLQRVVLRSYRWKAELQNRRHCGLPQRNSAAKYGCPIPQQVVNYALMVLVLKGNVAAGLRLSRASARSVALGAGCGTGGSGSPRCWWQDGAAYDYSSIAVF